MFADFLEVLTVYSAQHCDVHNDENENKTINFRLDLKIKKF